MTILCVSLFHQNFWLNWRTDTLVGVLSQFYDSRNNFLFCFKDLPILEMDNLSCRVGDRSSDKELVVDVMTLSAYWRYRSRSRRLLRPQITSALSKGASLIARLVVSPRIEGKVWTFKPANIVTSGTVSLEIPCMLVQLNPSPPRKNIATMSIICKPAFE